MADNDLRYCVRFVRRDAQPDECYHYWQREDAESHFNLFRDDDSDLYDHIDLLTIAGNLMTVSRTMAF